MVARVQAKTHQWVAPRRTEASFARTPDQTAVPLAICEVSAAVSFPFRHSSNISAVTEYLQKLGIAPIRTFNEDACISTLHVICSVAVVAVADHRLALNNIPRFR